MDSNLIDGRTGFLFLLPRLLRLVFLECSLPPGAMVNKVRSFANYEVVGV
jgi:hypothetical protein